MRLEAELRHRRPEDLPLPPDGDLEWEFNTEPVQDKSAGNVTLGKGRGEVPPGGSAGNGSFATPPSNRSSVEGRGGHPKGKKSEGAMPTSGSKSGRGSTETMGPVPPKHRPPRVGNHGSSRRNRVRA